MSFDTPTRAASFSKSKLSRKDQKDLAEIQKPMFEPVGITEAFLHATVSERELAWNNVALVAFSVCHVALSVALVRAHGTPGLILANVCNMGLRILYSMVFIQRYFRVSLTGQFQLELGTRLKSTGRLLCGIHYLAPTDLMT